GARADLVNASASASADGQSLPFQGVRPTSAPTGAAVRPTIFVLGAGLVLTAATALALRWVPALVDAAQPSAAAPLQPLEPEERLVLVSSQPSGAGVFVDGAKVGATPFELKLRRVDGSARGGEQEPEERAGVNTAPPAMELAPGTAPATGFSFRQENAPSVRARRETTADKVRLRAARREPAEPQDLAPQRSVELREQALRASERNALPREQERPQPDPREPPLEVASQTPQREQAPRAPERNASSDLAAQARPQAPRAPERNASSDLADTAQPLPEPPLRYATPDLKEEAQPRQQALPEPPPRHATLDLADERAPGSGNFYGP